MLPGEILPLPDGRKSMLVTTPIEVGGLADSFFRVSMGNPQRGALESPIPNTDHEVSELDVGLHDNISTVYS